MKCRLIDGNLTKFHCKFNESIFMAQFVLKTQGNIRSKMTNTNQKPVKSGRIFERENYWVSGITIIYLDNDD